MGRRSDPGDKMEAATEAGDCALTVFCGVIIGSGFAGGAFALFEGLSGMVAALVAVAAFVVGFVAGAVMYKLRWLLRSLFDFD